MLITDNPTELQLHMQETDEFLHQNIKTARQTVKHYADTHRRKTPAYKPGDKVMLLTENISLCRPTPKWSDKRVGPFKVIKESHKGNDSYLLDLPRDIKDQGCRARKPTNK